MRDKFLFSNGQALGTLNSTGVISSNYWDLEEDVTTDQMIEGWINIIIISSSNAAGDEGLDIELRSSDSTNGSSPQYLGCHKLIQSEIATGNRFSFGVSKHTLHKYLMLWYKAVSTSLDGATSIEAWFALGPITSPTLELQKRPS